MKLDFERTLNRCFSASLPMECCFWDFGRDECWRCCVEAAVESRELLHESGRRGLARHAYFSFLYELNIDLLSNTSPPLIKLQFVP